MTFTLQQGHCQEINEDLVPLIVSYFVTFYFKIRLSLEKNGQKFKNGSKSLKYHDLLWLKHVKFIEESLPSYMTMFRF